MSMQLQKLSLKAKFFRGLGDSTRLSILKTLRDKEKINSKIARETGQSQSNISNHLAYLLDRGLVPNQREGRYIFFPLSNKKIIRLLEERDTIRSDIVHGTYFCINYNDRFEKD